MPSATTLRVSHPLVMRWRTLPTRSIRGPRRTGILSWFQTKSPLAFGPVNAPFDFCSSIRHLVTDIAARCPEFQHLQVPRILITAIQARAGSRHGLQARVTPLRFQKGELIRMRRGVPYHIQRYFHGEHEYLYLLTFCLPRFLDQDFDQKFTTLFHELYHIGPAFDGDLRRHKGRYAFHSHRQCDYDKNMVQHARAYLATRPDPALHAFLRLTFAQLEAQHGSVSAVVVPRPKIVPIQMLAV